MPCDAEIKYYKEEVGGKDRIVLPNGQGSLWEQF